MQYVLHVIYIFTINITVAVESLGRRSTLGDDCRKCITSVTLSIWPLLKGLWDRTMCQGETSACKK